LAVLFHDEKIHSNLKRRRDLKNWIKKILELEGSALGDINIILTSDKNLRDINVKYLSRDYYTDIITFDYSGEAYISGDLYISLDRVRENAKTYKEDEQRELWRVMAHGVLHLLGYGDSGEQEKILMRDKENFYLDLIPSFK
jgi:probable rRNA maturation factor